MYNTCLAKGNPKRMLICHRHPLHMEAKASWSFPTHIGQVMQNADAMTLHTRKSWRHYFTFHSYTSNSCNTRRSRSVLPIIVYTLVSYDTTYLWSSLRSFPILWPCSLSFHCKWSFYILFNTTYFWSLTVALLIHCPVVISWAFMSVIPFA
jgi:hypothetical protein